MQSGVLRRLWVVGLVVAAMCQDVLPDGPGTIFAPDVELALGQTMRSNTKVVPSYTSMSLSPCRRPRCDKPSRSLPIRLRSIEVTFGPQNAKCKMRKKKNGLHLPDRAFSGDKGTRPASGSRVRGPDEADHWLISMQDKIPPHSSPVATQDSALATLNSF
jgi:hypothetical protein